MQLTMLGPVNRLPSLIPDKRCAQTLFKLGFTCFDARAFGMHVLNARARFDVF